MFRFDHDASQEGVGGRRTCFGRPNHRSEPTLHEHVAAPAIYWSRSGGMRAQASAWNVRTR
jgi:hypothetical protein